MDVNSPHVLELPEILSGILDYLEDDKDSLVSSCLVSRLWSDVALDVLWRNVSKQQSRQLALLIQPDRRQYYATKIQHIYPHLRDCDLSSLEFPRLRTCKLWLETGDGPIDQYLVPTLSAIGLSAIGLSSSMDKVNDICLRKLPCRCPNVRQISLYLYELRLDEITQCLRSFPQIPLLGLKLYFAYVMTVQDFVGLADLDQLGGLHLIRMPPTEVIELTLQQLSTKIIFRGLRVLHANLEARAAALLLPALDSLTRLNLGLSFSDEHDFSCYQAIGSRHTLQELRINIERDRGSASTRERLRALGNLNQLRKLTLSWECESDVCAADLVSFLSSFPRLLELCLDIPSELVLSEFALWMLGWSSPRLQVLILKATCNLRFPDSHNTPLFPNLTTLETNCHEEDAQDNFVAWAQESRATYAAISIRLQCPRLRHFECRDDYETFGRLIYDKFSVMLEENDWSSS